ncbi:MAG: cation:proton antiporter [Myxococcota bacterium]|nr:cation:proton antiporter [Myxococcota bacterium]
MKSIIGAAIVVLVALMGSRRTFTRIKIPLAARHIYLTGTEYIFVGLALGSQLLGALDTPTILGLNPLLHLALGWIGLMFGIQLDIPEIRRFPRQYFMLAGVQALSTVIICFVPLLVILSAAGVTTDQLAFAGALALGAMAVPTGQSSLALVHRALKLKRNKLTEILSYSAGIDAALGLAVFGFVFCYLRTSAVPGSPWLISTMYFFVSIGAGVIMGIMLHLLTRIRCSQEELLLFTIGTVVFSAGVATSLGISPLFITAVGGAVLANVRGAKTRVLRVLTSLEKPFYIVVLIIGGASVELPATTLIPIALAVAYIGLRTAGKLTGGAISHLMLRQPIALPATVGLGLISQGGIPAAMAVSFHQSFQSDISSTCLIIVLVAIVVNELISPALAEAVIQKAT